eukprot:Lankesteria_metandrocarpae@DN5118_c0_g1_i1.p1
MCRVCMVVPTIIKAHHLTTLDDYITASDGDGIHYWLRQHATTARHYVLYYCTVLLHCTTARHYRTPLPHATTPRHYSTPLLHATTARHYRTPLLHATTARHYRTPLLQITPFASLQTTDDSSSSKRQ